MAYQPFDATKPSGSDNGTAIPATANTNDVALRDAAIMGGMFKGFDFSTSGGTAAQPANFFWKNSSTWVKGVPTWGSGAGQDGNIVSMVWSLSTNSGSSYDTIATSALTFDSSGNLTAATGASGWLGWLMQLMGKLYTLTANTITHVANTGTAVHGLGTASTQNVNAMAISGGTATFTYEREVKVALGNVATSTAVNWAAAGLYTLTVTNAAAALTWTNLPSGVVGYLTLEITNGAIATSLLGSYKKQGGTALSFTNPGLDVVTLRCSDGSTVSVCGFEKDSKT